MQLLLAFKSFLPRRLIVENRQRELVRCRLPISAARTGSLQAANSATRTVSLLAPQFRQQMLTRSRQLNFGSDLLQTTPLWQRIASSLQNTTLGSELLIPCKRHSFGSESQIRCRQLSFDSEC
jgi:hypothetical protein